MKKNVLTIVMSIAMLMVMAMFVSNAALADDAAKSTAKSKPTMKMKADMPKGLLDGKEFVGEAGTADKTTGDKETIIFKHGTFHSVACDAYGFSPAPYTATANADGSIAFTATCTSPKMGTMEWSGTVTGDKLDATATDTQEGKDPMKMWAKCSLEASPMMGHKEHSKTMHKSETTTTTKASSGN